MHPMHRKLAPLSLLLLGLAGCAAQDPYRRDGVWRPAAANEQNLRAMVAVPSELTRGTELTPTEGHAAADAVERLRTDRVRELPVTGVSRIGAGGS
jgi:type IV pilus biogenesis protein CpaD/CtpE